MLDFFKNHFYESLDLNIWSWSASSTFRPLPAKLKKQKIQKKIKKFFKNFFLNLKIPYFDLRIEHTNFECLKNKHWSWYELWTFFNQNKGETIIRWIQNIFLEKKNIKTQNLGGKKFFSKYNNKKLPISAGFVIWASFYFQNLIDTISQSSDFKTWSFCSRNNIFRFPLLICTYPKKFLNRLVFFLILV